MSDSPIIADEFAVAMQQLSAEAKRSIPGESGSSARSAVVSEAAIQSIDRRLQEIERTLSKKIDDVVGAVTQKTTASLTSQLEEIEEHLKAIRNSETVNQRLFDSLHDELLKYRDNFVHESLQKPFIHDLVHLFDDLSSLAAQLQGTAQDQKKRAHLAQWRDNLQNAIHSLVEILHRFDVKEIEPVDRVDRTVHKVISYEPADYAEEDGVIVMRIKRGFFWRDKVIRPEEVIAKRFA